MLPHEFPGQGQVRSVAVVVWPVYCELAGDEDVEEGEGQNDNSGESDEAPPKVSDNNTFLNSFIHLLTTVYVHT